MDPRKRPLRNKVQLKSIGVRIRKLRLEKGISQEALADAARIERSYMGAIERAERNPSIDKLASIAKALKVSLPKLLAN